MSSDKNLLLRHTHPQLFKGLILKTLILFAIGLLIALGEADYVLEPVFINNSRTIPLEFWGGIFITTAAMLLFGASNGTKRYGWARKGLVIMAGISGLFGVAHLFAVLNGSSERVLLPILWAYMCANAIIWSGEPAFNPLASALENNRRNGGKNANRNK